MDHGRNLLARARNVLDSTLSYPLFGNPVNEPLNRSGTPRVAHVSSCPVWQSHATLAVENAIVTLRYEGDSDPWSN